MKIPISKSLVQRLFGMALTTIVMVSLMFMLLMPHHDHPAKADPPFRDMTAQDNQPFTIFGDRAVVNHLLANSQNSTIAVQSAIDNGTSTVVIPYKGNPWIVEPIRLRSGLQLIMEPGVILEAKRGSFKGQHDSIFLANEVHDVSIIGYGATIRMHKEDYQSSNYEKAEWRHGIALKGASHINIKGLCIDNTGGDGIYVGCTWDNKRTPCRDIHIADCTLVKNHRQGISIVAAYDVEVEHCLITQTSGTAPQAGIDVEPSHYLDPLVNIVIKNCQVIENSGSGFMVNISRHTMQSKPISISIQQCYVQNTIQPGLRAILRKDFGATGTIKFVDCNVSDTQYAGATIVWDTTSTVGLSFNNCKWANVANRVGESPILLEMETSPGKRPGIPLEFNNVEIFDNRDRQPVQVKQMNMKPINNIKGNIRVIGTQSDNITSENMPNLKIERKQVHQ